jgi:LCP family protein required for cell wall assembly
MRRSRASMKPRSVALITALGAVVVAAVAVALVAVWTAQRASVAIKADAATTREVAIVLKPPPPQSPFEYIVLLGDDRLPGQTRARTDTIILVGINRATGDANMVSIPRDTYTEVPGYGMTKINHAGAYGGPALSIRTIAQFTGIDVTHYIRIDFAGMERLIDLMGGVDVSDGVNPVKHLHGRLAVSFLRQRKIYAAGDFKRMDNQQRVLLVLAKKLRSPSTIASIPSILDALSGHLDTDLSVDQLRDLANRTSGRPINNFVLTGKTTRIGGVSYVIVDPAVKAKLFSAFAKGELPLK